VPIATDAPQQKASRFDPLVGAQAAPVDGAAGGEPKKMVA
jgi:hypothetical protein